MSKNDEIERDLRLGDLISKKPTGDSIPRAVLIGFPCDEGVRRNHGRPGAAKGPSAIREALFKLTPGGKKPQRMLNLLSALHDEGDLKLGDDMEENQEILSESVASHLTNGTIPIILGGGHETSFGHFLGYVKTERKVHIVNWDAHTDVRPCLEGKGHSGTPFNQAVLHSSNTCLGYTVVGLQEHLVAPGHIEFLNDHDCRYVWKRKVSDKTVKRVYSKISSPIMATFDIDAVDQAHAPGVSSPTANGLSPHLWLQAARMAGRNRQVASFDLVEFNPDYDCDGQTARLAALTVWSFLNGLAKRLEKESH